MTVEKLVYGGGALGRLDGRVVLAPFALPGERIGAEAVLRGLVTMLGKNADAGLADPADRLRPLVEPLLKLRESLRRECSYAAADDIRAALVAGGVELRDSPDGTDWSIIGS